MKNAHFHISTERIQWKAENSFCLYSCVTCNVCRKGLRLLNTVLIFHIRSYQYRRTDVLYIFSVCHCHWNWYWLCKRNIFICLSVCGSDCLAFDCISCCWLYFLSHYSYLNTFSRAMCSIYRPLSTQTNTKLPSSHFANLQSSCGNLLICGLCQPHRHNIYTQLHLLSIFNFRQKKLSVGTRYIEFINIWP